MATDHPLLKLPPAQDTFLKIRALYPTLINKLGHLQDALAAFQDIHFCLEGLRNAGNDHITDPIFGVLYDINKFTGQYLKLLDAVATEPYSESTKELLESVINSAEDHATSSRAAKGYIGGFDGYLSTTIQDITKILTDNVRDGTWQLIPENSQVIDDLSQAVDECCTLLEGSAEYYKEMETHLQDVKLKEYALPQLTDLNTVRQKWQEFFECIQDLTKGISRIGSRSE